MKKTIKFLCIFLILISLFGCSKETSELNIDSENYLFDTDYQYFINSTSVMARSDKGYYYFDDCLLKFFDTEKRIETVVCDQSNCEHTDNDCSAYFDHHYSKTVLSYYNGSLITDYIETKNNISTHYACSISTDGKSRKKKCKLYKTTGSSSARFCVHRGYVYLVRELASEEKNKSTLKIYKAPLETKKNSLQEIFSFTGYDCSLTGFEIYANHLYFDLSYYTDSKGNGYSTVVFDYDLINDKCNEINLNNYEYGFIVNNRNIVYYNKKSQNYDIYNIDTKKVINKININEIGYISFDGENYYIDTAQSVNIGINDIRTIYIVNPQGKILKEISIDNDNQCHFGYKDFIFFDKYNNEFGSSKIIKIYYDKAINNSSNSEFISVE